MVQQKNIALCIVLYVVTCGLYGLYWIVTITDDINFLADPPNKTSGGMVLLLTLVTCGLYGLYWAYKMGEYVDEARSRRGLPMQNLAVLHLILELLVMPVGWAIFQNEINTLATSAPMAE